jgi:predicted double-glycine peptidase
MAAFFWDGSIMLFQARVCTAIGIIACLAVEPAHATEARVPTLAFGNLVPGLSLLSKPVRSMRELRFDNIVRQERDFTCGAAALSTILRYVYGRTSSEHDIIEDMLQHTDVKTVQENGFSLLDIKKYVERIGLRGRGYRVDRNSLLALKIPVIALQNSRGYSHFVVVKRVRDGIVYLADPALGQRHLPLDEFVDAWNGIVFAILGPGLQPENALLESVENPPGAAQRAAIVTRILPQQHEFGLLGLDSF